MIPGSEFGLIPDRAVSFLMSEGYLAPSDCAMAVATGKGEFARALSRSVRVMVCMDIRPGSLERTKAAVEGGCRAEMMAKDWNSYAVSRGSYDSCLISPSRLCFDIASIMRMEQVSSRSCIAAIPVRSDRRKMVKALLHSTGSDEPLPAFPDSREVLSALRGSGRDVRFERFSEDIECPEEDLVNAMLSLCPPGTDARECARDLASTVTDGGVSRYSAEVAVAAWNVPR